MENVNLYGENKTKWYKFKLGEIISYKKGYAFKSENYRSTGIRIVKISDTTESSIKLDNITCIDVEKYNEYKEWALRENDIIISTVGSRPPLYDSMVGKVVKVPLSCNNALLNQNMVRLRTTENVNQQYLYYLLKTRRYLNHIENICRGNANQVSITLDELFDYKIDVPPLEEQEKIVEILSTWDLAIEKQEQLIEKKKEFKKGLMQRLLSGEVRFNKENGDSYPEWNQVKLGEYLVKHNEKSEFNNQYPVLTSSRKGIFLQSDYYAGNDVASDDTTGYNVVPRGYFTYRHMSDDLIFKFNINDIVDKGIVSTLYPVFTVKNMDAYFLRTKLNEGNEFKRFALAQKQGGSRTYMYYSKLETLKLNIPCLEEQERISEVLKSADKEIELLEKELEALKLQKKGLMQRLLTGEVRVKV